MLVNALNNGTVLSSFFCSNYGILMEITVSMVNLKVYLSSLYGKVNWRINARTEYQGNTEMYFCLFVLSVRSTPDTTHFSPIYGYTYIGSYLLRLQEEAVYTSLTYLF